MRVRSSRWPAPRESPAAGHRPTHGHALASHSAQASADVAQCVRRERGARQAPAPRAAAHAPSGHACAGQRVARGPAVPVRLSRRCVDARAGTADVWRDRAAASARLSSAQRRAARIPGSRLDHAARVPLFALFSGSRARLGTIWKSTGATSTSHRDWMALSACCCATPNARRSTAANSRRASGFDWRAARTRGPISNG